MCSSRDGRVDFVLYLEIQRRDQNTIAYESWGCYQKSTIYTASAVQPQAPDQRYPITVISRYSTAGSLPAESALSGELGSAK